ncbi:MAG: response regulator [Rhodothermales bacterium]|nr:response regulator [Rhodothermales bacterium]MBO6779463.1 response regulator [Rhodothermales bacterium]
MSLIISFASGGLVVTVCLVGGVFSIFKAAGWGRKSNAPQAENENEAGSGSPTAAKTSEDESSAPKAEAPVAYTRPEPVREDRAPAAPPATQTPRERPVAPVATERSVAPAPRRNIAEDLEALRILVAEDNPINRKVMQLLLRRLGYEADIAVDGQQAVEMATAKVYDAILMDLHMPRMGGIEATEAIVTRLDPAPRVVAVTADVTQQAKEECQRVGMAAYLTKPVDSNLLLHELKQAEAHRLTG